MRPGSQGLNWSMVLGTHIYCLKTANMEAPYISLSCALSPNRTALTDTEEAEKHVTH